MKIKYDEIEIFQKSMTTFKKTSCDSDGKTPGFMTSSSVEVINFDNVKKCYVKNMKLSCDPCSNDALYYDSLLIFNDIVGTNISFCRENVCFILVYNERKNPYQEDGAENEDSAKARIGKHFSKKAKKKFVRFDLNRFKTLYFQDVFTYTEKEFEEEFLACIEEEGTN